MGARPRADRGSSLNSRVPVRVLLIRVPYYFGDPKRDPDLGNYPCADSVVAFQVLLVFYLKVPSHSIFAGWFRV